VEFIDRSIHIISSLLLSFNEAETVDVWDPIDI